MDDVSIPTTNPVKPVSTPPVNLGVSPKPKPAGTFVNFFFMMPLAVIVLLQTYFLGQSIGEYTTFPPLTLRSYFALGTILTLMVLMQLFLRSIVYSTLFGFFLVAGIFSGWFGEFLGPVTGNLRETVTILRTSISKKDIPYPILMSGLLSSILFFVMVANFLFSLFVKYFFEVSFDREWSDGRRNGYIAAIILMLFAQSGFNYYSNIYSDPEILIWKKFDRYQPLEEFIVRVPSAVQVLKNNLCVYSPKIVSLFRGKDGEGLKTNSSILPHGLTPSTARLEFPIIPTNLGLVGFDKDLDGQKWLCQFPIKLPIASISEKIFGKTTDSPDEAKQLPEDLGFPIGLQPDLSDDYIVAFFDYGVRGVISKGTGKALWADVIDTPRAVNKLYVDEYITNPWVLVDKKTVIFSCYNGRISAVNAETGLSLWEHSQPDSIHGANKQRALLSRSGSYLLAAFPTGEIITFDFHKGTKIYEARSGIKKWTPATPAILEEKELSFVGTDGNYYRVMIDGGEVLMSESLFPSPPPLMPTPISLQDGVACYRDQIYSISSSARTITPILTYEKHIFATKPVVDGKFMYAGTQDGWVFCLHKLSFDKKWEIHVGGELEENSLISTDFGIVVRTKSGSVYCLKKGPRKANIE